MTDLEPMNRLRADDPVSGTLIVSTSSHRPEATRGRGFDVAPVDTGHIAIDRGELSWIRRAYPAIGIPPIVRMSSPNSHMATVALDRGAAGVLAPYVE